MSEKLESFLFKSISYNMILQLSFRILSFILNAILYRNVHTDLIGACNFRLALLYTTIMFLSREPFRRALPKMSDIKQKNNVEKFINSLWLVIPSGVLIATFFGILWNFFEKPSELTVKNYDISIIVLCFSCIIELCGEPSYSLSQMYYLAKLKVIIEASCLLIFNVIFILLALFVPELGALAYSLARFINAILFVLSNVYFLLKHKPKDDNITLKNLFPNSIKNFDVDYLMLVKAYYAQSIFKQVLTEGERYLITFFNLLNYSESGIYDIVNNLGSLFARFVFLPIEDASYIYFTNSLKRGISYKNQTESKSKTYFEFLLKSLSTMGLVVLIFGQSYSRLLLQIYGGSKLGENDLCVNLLRFHCIYIYFLALNGITEGFFNATMSESQINKHNYRLVLFSILFLLFNFISVNLFSIYGFLAANCLNMFIRILFSSFYIKNFFDGFKFKNENYELNFKYNVINGYLPNVKLSVVFVIVLGITKISENYFSSVLHLAIGIICFCLTVLAVLKEESQIKNFVFDTIKKFKRV